jgi:hypothetical protein
LLLIILGSKKASIDEEINGLFIADKTQTGKGASKTQLIIFSALKKLTVDWRHIFNCFSLLLAIKSS